MTVLFYSGITSYPGVSTEENRKEVSRLPKTSDHIQKMAPLVRYHDISHFWNYCISEPSPSRGQKIQQFLGKWPKNASEPKKNGLWGQSRELRDLVLQAEDLKRVVNEKRP